MMRFSLKSGLVFAIAVLITGTIVQSSIAQVPPTQHSDEAPKDHKAEMDRLLKQGNEQMQAQQFDAAISSWKAALKIAREIGDRRGEGNSLMFQGLVHQLRKRHADALREYEAALLVFQAIKHQYGETHTLRLRGMMYVIFSRYEEAIQSFDASLPGFRAMNDREKEAQVLQDRGYAYRALSRYEEAIQSFNQALPIFQTLKNQPGVADILLNRGNIYRSLARHEEAIQSFDQALPIFQAIQDRQGEILALMNQGNSYASLSRFEEAIKSYNRALQIAQAINDRGREAHLLMSRGNVHDLLSRYEDALRDYDTALLIAETIKARITKADVLTNRGLTYRSLLRFEEALTSHDEALRIYRELKNKEGEASALTNLASTYFSLSLYEGALFTLDQALPIFRAIGNRSGEASTLLSQGFAYNALSRHQDATRSYNQALSIFRAIKNRKGEASVLWGQADVLSGLSRYADAIKVYKQALSILQTVKDREGQARVLNNLGLAQFKLGRISEAEQFLRSAIALYETIRLDGLSEENKISFFETQASSYLSLQKVLIAQNRPEAALSISEWGRTKALIERLTQQFQLTKSPSISQPPTIESLTQIARSQNTTLVEYSIISSKNKEELLYIWVVQPSGKVTFRQVEIAAILPPQCSSLIQLVDHSRRSIGVRSTQSDWLIVDAKTQKNPCIQTDPDANFKTLHKLLIEPIASLLPTDPNQHVVFIPDRSIFLVPFPALKDAKGKYLIEKHTIRTASSIQLLAKTQALKSRPKGQGALIVGNPLMPNDPTLSQPKPLTNLPGAEREAIAIAPLLNTKAITGQAGTKQAILEQISNARVVHLATHGSFYGLNGVRSWLALAPSSTDNGILKADEIAQLKLSADLVVLSACDTGRGRITGDGIVGLSRSFIVAGVPSVVVSLWTIPDAPTADLMKEFYQQLQRNPDKAQALRQAMLMMLKTHPEPKQWAGFTLIGEP
ncbi:tetratricopeptide repeat protein [Leptolyngbya boryana CZ1]|uniref:Tetratricopeptide repeat protein n=1 Tax=Leptolyngbya boryana CZ1 TaxID=3060204 RepID=A0AA96WU75_LEPBY|nr:CHAT domain-containing protein [Leptolyngbya boryana]WNZ45288.1 tetratricopeptide repeat protein [Leptolyngbya boryana CZ1]